VVFPRLCEWLWGVIKSHAKAIGITATVGISGGLVKWLADIRKSWHEGTLAKKELRRQNEEPQLYKCRNAVADALRPMRDFGLTEGEITTKVTTCSPKEIEKAIRYWEEKGLIRPASHNRWVWQPSKIYRS
jgi:hypothetical protein